MDAGGKTRSPESTGNCLQRSNDDCSVAEQECYRIRGYGLRQQVGQSPCSRRIAGTAAGARSGKYPLARYLYMFTNGWPEGDVLDFINYMQSPAGQKIVNSTGFVSLQEMK